MRAFQFRTFLPPLINIYNLWKEIEGEGEINERSGYNEVPVVVP